ncbi:MAG: hypothetical protein ACREX4_11345 [Gammaproteobacteria bacterium]
MSRTKSQHIDDQFQSLLQAVESIRSEQFSDLDPELVRELLRLHADGAMSDAQVTREIERRVEAHLAEKD